ncbi:pilus assembly protein PilY [Acidithiobacillus sp. 'AMD consortium']|uniref:Type IV pilus biogenesis factor PilY1 n=3 Tax=Acidithiobacillus ferridurans TaxID=1232575 RepID=A0A2Z6IGN3_ACIFI|nr:MULTISPECIES: PilC/PilY family type IV pilus protein [Acidithiobacillus]MBU2717000.1 pilus assembly protein PilY [Acidithiobacillus ferridurans]MBU2726278.1 pilus assembly protein PilY [Acidithiobacillus ferridurans]QFG78723.1 pilus assembly protein PilY [Acidithiobacillus sp. 'AMD consortium']BBF63964.1 Type IV pilus biogenesis factor PilY1 [Acidithiobacillus ferridurans]
MRHGPRTRHYPLWLGAALAFSPFALAGAATLPPTLPISSIPLISVQYGAPQVLFVLDNSQSMDGNLAGAIMTGSGTATDNGNPVDLNSSSPANYTVPAGFTAPVSGTTSGSAPYTVNGTDNSASRLNVAKEAIQQAYNQWNGVMDFGLMDYGVKGTPSKYTTWVYYMSGPDGFAFGTSSTAPTQTKDGLTVPLQSVPNPCYYPNTQATTSCQDIHAYFTRIGVSGSFSDPWLYIQDTSDEPDINDVLYASRRLPSNFITYAGPHPTSPYTGYTLSNYNNGTILENYNKSTVPGAFGTSPTNAGYVPYSPQVWYSERGFGYDNNITNSGSLPISIQKSTATQGQLFAAQLAPETNTNSSEIKADAINATMAGTLASAYDYLMGTSGPALPSSTCTSKKYVILVTDGLPTVDNQGGLWPPLGSAAAAGYGVTATFNQNGTVNTTNDQALTDTIAAITTLQQAGIDTYVVGMGAGVDPSLNPTAYATLNAMAIAGGTQKAIAATSPAAVAQSLTAILQAIEANQSTTGVALNSSSQAGANLVYQASYTTKVWIGNLKAETLSSVLSTPNSPTISWQAVGANPGGTITSGSLQNGSAPNVFSWNPACTKTTACGIPFTWNSLSSTQQTDLDQGYYSTLSGSQQASFGSAAAYGQAIMQWLLNGNTSGGVFRTPSALLADIVDSTPLYVGPPNDGSLEPSYQNFVTAHATRTPMVYVGSNGGMLYGFNALTGAPVFSFVPNGVYPNLAQLPQLNYTHQYYVDGSPTEADIQFSGGTTPWNSVLVGGLDSGGDSIYALNVTDPTSFSASDVMWEFTNPDLGLTYSQPQIAEVDDNGTPTWAAIFGSGYNSPAGWPYLFIVNAQTGTLIQSVDLCSYLPASEASYCSASYPDGLSTPAVASSGNGFVAGTVYAGDLQGNLWRINVQQLLNPTTSTSSGTQPPAVSVLFHATTTQTTTSSTGVTTTTTVPQPITTQPTVTASPRGAPPGNFVTFGTGQLLTTSDLTNTNVQSIYAVLDNGSGTTITQSQLQARGITGATATNGQKVIVAAANTSNLINWASQDGWYLPLTDAGSGNIPVGLRSITNMDLNLNRLIFTLYAPNTATCGGTGQSYLMILNYAEGTTFGQPQFFVNNNLSNPLTSGGANVSGVSLGNQYAGAPTQSGNHLLIPLGNGTITPFTLAPPPLSPVGWRSIIQ